MRNKYITPRLGFAFSLLMLLGLITLMNGNYYSSPSIELMGKAKITGGIFHRYLINGATAAFYNENISNRTKIKEKPVANNVADERNAIASEVREISATKTTKNSGGIIYLTFDDGPSSNVTPKILDILNANNVKATFFIIDYSAEDEHLVRRIYKEGHTIGIHGYSHDYRKIYSSKEAFMENIATLREKIKLSTGCDSSIIRFPGGSSNTVSRDYNLGIMTRLTMLVKEEGYRYFDWNVESGDTDRRTVNKDKIVSRVTSNLVKDRSNIVLMHDPSTKTTTADALQEIIDYGKSNGFTFLPIDYSTKELHHKPNN